MYLKMKCIKKYVFTKCKMTYSKMTLKKHVCQGKMYFNKMVFTSQTQLLLMYLMYYSGNMSRLAIESSSDPYIKIQIFNLL